ncbi:MAG: hypothetical protein DIZ80_16735 [endosymbiont of Galathealinum brachiosum]|uniref:Uncharacterized protein n=1 Tax=endosymbiont of Galathealinum brachiosum TaxID=2200906 RepID=A0A370D6M2_9GAMM|nr:MAG: hypothetical protein DIZ80_16735 [endosymbiont of Galathealinum brachiosum]
MKLYSIIFVLLLSSCAIFIQEHELPAINAIEIHDNPRAGDFAILEDRANGFKSTWHVDKVDGDRIHVSFIWEFKSEHFSKKSHYLMTTTRKGKVLSARFKYSDKDIKKQPVATINGSNSRMNYERKPVPTSIVATTPAGKFDIDKISSFELFSDIGGIARSENNFIMELSNDVPFNVVKMYVTNTINKGAVFTTLESFESLLILTAAQNPVDAYSRAIESVMNKNDDNTLEIEYSLTSFGRGK